MKHLTVAATVLLAWPAAAQNPEPRPTAAVESQRQETPEAENRIDRIRPDAPELAPCGEHPIGVRTLTFTDEGRIDVVNTTEEGEPPTYDRKITVEVWYPAAEGTEPGGAYQALLRDGVTEVTLSGAPRATPLPPRESSRSSSSRTAIRATVSCSATSAGARELPFMAACSLGGASLDRPRSRSAARAFSFSGTRRPPIPACTPFPRG